MRAAFLIALAILLAMMLKNWMNQRSSYTAGADWAVYGTMGCGWTRKQLEDMDSKGIKYNFIDCDKQDCPGMDAFPTVKSLKDGKVTVGFTSL